MSDPNDLVRQDFLLMLNERVGNLETLIQDLTSRFDVLQYQEISLSFEFCDKINRSEWLQSDFDNFKMLFGKGLTVDWFFKINEIMISPILWRYKQNDILTSVKTGGNLYIKLSKPYFMEQIKDFMYSIRNICLKEEATNHLCIWDSFRRTTKDRFCQENLPLKQLGITNLEMHKISLQ